MATIKSKAFNDSEEDNTTVDINSIMPPSPRILGKKTNKPKKQTISPTPYKMFPNNSENSTRLKSIQSFLISRLWLPAKVTQCFPLKMCRVMGWETDV